jgi:hypothetical protein
VIHTPDLSGNLRDVIDESASHGHDELEAVAERLRAQGVTGWTERELADLVDFDGMPRHPATGWRVDGSKGRARVRHESQDSARDRGPASA